MIPRPRFDGCRAGGAVVVDGGGGSIRTVVVAPLRVVGESGAVVADARAEALLGAAGTNASVVEARAEVPAADLGAAAPIGTIAVTAVSPMAERGTGMVNSGASSCVSSCCRPRGERCRAMSYLLGAQCGTSSGRGFRRTGEWSVPVHHENLLGYDEKCIGRVISPGQKVALGRTAVAVRAPNGALSPPTVAERPSNTVDRYPPVDHRPPGRVDGRSQVLL
jgi:hypothetical protein